MTDVEIAKSIPIKNINEIATSLGISEGIEPYGNYKITCKWMNPIKGADIWIRDVITYTVDE